MIKILNLYAGIGGNRKLWPNDQIEVTAVGRGIYNFIKWGYWNGVNVEP